MPVWLIHTLRQAAWAPLTVLGAYLIATKGFHTHLLYPSLSLPTYFLGGMAITYFYLSALHFAQMLIGATPRLIQQIAALGLCALTAIFLGIFGNHRQFNRRRAPQSEQQRYLI